MPEQSWTIASLLKWTTGFLESKGIDSPRLDAELLLAEALGCSRVELYMEYNREPDERSRDRFRDLVRRRASREPVQYILGRAEFYALEFEVTPEVLIPRPETEYLVAEAVGVLSGGGSVEGGGLAADVGTGSGNAAVSLAVNRPGARVIGTDSSPAALAVARRNVARHGVAGRVELREGDLLAPLGPEAGGFDCVMSNPPYVAEGELIGLMPEVRDHEPRCALLAGPDGLAVARRLLEEAPAYLCPGGWLILELGAGQAAAAQRIAACTGRYGEVRSVKDQQGIERILALRKG